MARSAIARPTWCGRRAAPICSISKIIAAFISGTDSGSVLASRDEGDTWNEIARCLPTIAAY